MGGRSPVCSDGVLVLRDREDIAADRPTSALDRAGEARGVPIATGRKETIARHTAIARAVTRKDPHYVLPDEELERFGRG